MKNITVSIPDETYRQARVWAAKRDTSISAVVKYMIGTLPGIRRTPQAIPAIKSNETAGNSPKFSENVRL